MSKEARIRPAAERRARTTHRITDFDDLEDMLHACDEIYRDARLLALRWNEDEDALGVELGRIVNQSRPLAEKIQADALSDVQIPKWCDINDPTDVAYLRLDMLDPLERAAVHAFSSTREFFVCVGSPLWESCPGVYHELKAAWQELVWCRKKSATSRSSSAAAKKKKGRLSWHKQALLNIFDEIPDCPDTPVPVFDQLVRDYRDGERFEDLVDVVAVPGINISDIAFLSEEFPSRNPGAKVLRFDRHDGSSKIITVAIFRSALDVHRKRRKG